MNDHHALITQLCDELDHNRRCLLDDRRVTHPLADRARAVLDRPEPEGLTDDKLMDIARATGLVYCMGKGGFASRYQEDTDITAEVLAFARAALAADGPAVPDGREPASVVGEPSDEELLATLDKATATFPPRHPEAEALNAVEYPLKLELRKARAVIARYGHQPAPPAEPEPGFPTTQELKTFACEWWRTFGLVKNKATCTWVLDQVDPEHFADFARDVLARWGRQPAPPAAGEVASDIYFEFVISDADYCTQAGGIALTYAQALSEGQHYLAQYQQDGPHTLELRRVEVLNPDALPLPAGEVEQ